MTNLAEKTPLQATATRLGQLIPEVTRHWELIASEPDGTSARAWHEVESFLRPLVGAMKHGSPPEDALPATPPPDPSLSPAQVHRSLDRVLRDLNRLQRLLVETLEAEAPLPPEGRYFVEDAFRAAERRAAATYTALDEQRVRDSEEQLRDTLRARAEELEQTNERMSRFLAMIAHELRTPLSTINNALYILDSLSLSDQAARQVAAAARQTRHAARLVGDLMDLSRIARGKLELRREKISLRRFAADAIESVRPLMDSRGHQVTLDLSADPLLVEADPLRIEQILNNLLTNAAKYTDPGGCIRLSAYRRDDQAVLSVHDNGMGIDPEMLPRIFDFYEQFGLSETRSHGGLGVGLPLVKRLAEFHGGAVSARSEGPGRGSEFEVSFPLAHNPAH